MRPLAPKTARTRVVILLVSIATVLVAGASAATVMNGDFETGDLTGWTMFTTSNGTLGLGGGLPTVAMFDTTGTGPSNAAKFEVGAATLPSSLADRGSEGGGIYQSLTTGPGLFTASADTAAINTFTALNGSCGRFELLVDGEVVSSHDYGGCQPNITLRFTLTATGLALTAGSHEIRIRITRQALSGMNLTPFQYVDNVALTQILPTTIDQCMKGGWMTFGGVFGNQGRCVAFVASGGEAP